MDYEVKHEEGYLTNGRLRLEYLTQSGPRITGFKLVGGENLLAQTGKVEKTPWGDFHFYGGHRLWRSPESFPETYSPDDTRLQVNRLAEGVELLGAVEGGSGLQKSITVQFNGAGDGVRLTHTLRNVSAHTLQIAPWAITMLRTGGLVILPQNPGEEGGLLPNRNLAFWPYTRADDPRLTLSDTCIKLRAIPGGGAFKIGQHLSAGWMGYRLDDVLFIKRFSGQPGNYPDGNCNAEVYLCDDFVELESLGPLASVEPGGCLIHEEKWLLYAGYAARVPYCQISGVY